MAGKRKSSAVASKHGDTKNEGSTRLAKSRQKLVMAKEKFRQNGYCVLEGLLEERQLEALRRECSEVVNTAYHRLQTQCAKNGAGPVPSDWVVRNHGCVFQVPLAEVGGVDYPSSSSEYRLARTAAMQGKSVERQVVLDTLFNGALRDIMEYLLGGAAWLYNEQFIVKPPNCSRSEFKWHKDNTGCQDDSVDYRPYLSMWCALDDMHEENGTLYVRPYPLPMCATLATSVHLGLSEDSIHRVASSGYPDPSTLNGADDGGVPLTLNAGSVVIISDRVLHCSTGNLSAAPRRVWMPQFSNGPLLRRKVDNATKTTRIMPVALAVPLRELQSEFDLDHNQ
mmetsp:Transcript_4767/g.6420  ORF Transcript_4767/g.6420 Transcript_4767/m.6420 type:complete len:338 (-) Transcript_4767:254-1267(-)|eukprot:CAMPEP_0196582728 /NCGR_PEP_ID=MMETSP1081-20130531/40315_1 /TAXON_ID=36882 /ORGANISM="Pyramimonas amylifera, Strain CCMP720" /LENGTH=337 /DNA_ID=CAMNT_0041903385 /DNA_START=392 /DNA_END=1405 /DNA_ORIENTATION=-